jgi:hypothetical protein
VDGCFWHGCPKCYRAPASNVRYWRAKIDRNRARDLRVRRELRKRGWAVLRLWECQLKEAAQTLRIQKMLAKGDRLYRFVWAEVRDSALRYLMKNVGETFNLDDNVEILKINSPTAKVKGPYKVVAKP